MCPVSFVTYLLGLYPGTVGFEGSGCGRSLYLLIDISVEFFDINSNLYIKYKGIYEDAAPRFE